jgi:hypothetical protein
MDIQLILEFKNSFGKNCPVFPKNPKHFFVVVCFLGQKVLQNFNGL